MDLKITNIGQLATYSSRTGSVERLADMEVIVEDEQIIEIGQKLPRTDSEIDAGGCLVTPGLVDSHTHPVFAGTRENEFALRVEGKTYQEIVQEGGGIRASVRALREIDEDNLIEIMARRMTEFLSFGTTTLEAKSGYGLSTESEMKSLRALQKVSQLVEIEIVPTFLGAHDFPEEFIGNRDDYVALVCNEMIPLVAEGGWAEFCDVFCEKGWFNVDESRRILETARGHGLKLRLHADEFEDSGGAALAAELKAFSADHLMHVTDDGIRQMAESGTVATLLPGTTFFLRQGSYAPARKLLKAGVDVAVASDFNPGSSMIKSMPFIMSLACLYLGMTVEEAFAASTFVAAKSLNRENVVGSIETGKQADLVVWDLKELTEIPYHVASRKVKKVIKKGTLILESNP